MKSPRNYYNEFDPKAAAWLRELIKAGLIPDGDVDERSIEDVTPTDLHGYTQCHFFAGIGGWVHALDLAGWPRDRSVWTGSCPCQPFSAAGQGAGFADERHLWPAWQHLIAQCRPPVVFGEQVASKAADAWIDLVHADLEGMGYAFGSVPFPAAGIGAPHIRDRNYWVARASGAGFEEQRRQRNESARPSAPSVLVRVADDHQHGRIAPPVAGIHDTQHHAESCGGVVGMGDADSERAGRNRRAVCGSIDRQDRELCADDAGAPSRDCGLADCASGGRREERADGGRRVVGDCPQGVAAGFGDGGGDSLAGPVNGHWAAADWIGCRDGKWRPVEPGTQPLAHGIPGRVVRLRGYGNAIVPQQAAQFVAAFCESLSAELREAA